MGKYNELNAGISRVRAKIFTIKLVKYLTICIK
jgi:hypothetical protein